MKDIINRFSKVFGDYVENIDGQTRYGYSFSDYQDFYEIEEIIKYSGYYKGSIIRFHDFETGQLYIPFDLEKNVVYGRVTFLDSFYYFLKADFNTYLITLYSYYPGKTPEKKEDFYIKNLNLYNLMIIGDNPYVVSSDENLEIYSPIRKTIKLENNETCLFIKDDKLYISAWIEEGWDDENNVASPNYEYYNKFIIKDMNGKIISEERGNLFQNIDGKWWLS